MKEFLKILSFKKPRLSYIKIGAGTGGATTALFEALSTPKGVMLDQYHYTDISAGFFGAARVKFAEWADHIEFKTLDIEKNPVQQGFTLGSYDVVVASNVLYATKDMDATLANVRMLLKPGGIVVLLKVTHNFVANNAVFGTLPRWWAFEDGQEDSPLLSKEQWNELLIRHSFRGIDLTRTLIMVSRAVEAEATEGAEQTKTATVKLLKGYTTDSVNTVAKAISAALKTRGLNLTDEYWEELTSDQNVTYIILNSVSRPLLLCPPLHMFNSLWAIANNGNNILWVTI